MITTQQSHEWQDAAMWMARRGYTGQDGEPLPELLSADVAREIAEHPEEFQREIRAAAYFLVRTRAWGHI